MISFEKFFRIFFCLYALLLLSIPSLCYCQDKVVIAAGDWSPFLSNTMKNFGTAGKVIKEAFAKENVDVKFVFLPWRRAYVLTLKGEYNATGIWFKNEEREKIFYYSDPVAKEKFVFFHLKENPFTWTSVNDLKSLALGGLIGFSYGEKLDGAINSGVVKIDRTSKDVYNFRKLLIKRIDVYPQEMQVGYHVIQTELTKAEANKITHSPDAIKMANTYLLFSKQIEGNEKYVIAFNNGLKKIKKIHHSTIN